MIAPGDIVVLNSKHDLMMDGTLKHYIGQQVAVVKITKSGLYQIRATDGSLHSVPKRNLDVGAPPDGESQ